MSQEQRSGQADVGIRNILSLCQLLMLSNSLQREKKKDTISKNLKSWKYHVLAVTVINL